MKGQLIGQGNTAEVFFWNDNEIIKLFRQKFPMEGVDREYNVSKMVETLGLPVPKVGQMIELEGRRGIIYEKISGKSMLDLIMKNPGAVTEYSKSLAALHYQMHLCRAKGLPKYKEALEWNIRHTEHLSENQRIAILDILEKLPEGEALCHGDFHPGNVIMEEDKSVILDWMTATAGNPAADVARTVMLLKDGALPDHMSKLLKFVIRLTRKRIVNSYLKEYIHLSGMTKEAIAQWRIPIIAARLTEWVPEIEKKAILKELEQHIN